jgi:hypothetical protein
MKLKQRMIRHRNHFVKVTWGRLREPQKDWVVKTLDTILNYLANATFLSIPISIAVKVPFWKTLICVWLLIPMIEHYYIWFRAKWKEDAVK